MAVRLRRRALPPPSHSTAWLLPMLQGPVGSRGELDFIQSFLLGPKVLGLQYGAHTLDTRWRLTESLSA